MKALFITTNTADCYNHVQAWDSFSGVPAEHHTFSIGALRNDWQAVDRAEAVGPDVIFYIGAYAGRGIPLPGTFRHLRTIAPTINLCSDAADRPWHAMLTKYRAEECFDLQVSLDGAKPPAVPVDLATLTPVDPGPFRQQEKDINCGFSGSVGRYTARSEVIRALEWFGGLTVRKRADGQPDSYLEHGAFLGRCRMLLNTSWTGTGHAHHIKGRVLEAGWAGCALLEQAGSPIGEWFPSDCWLPWGDPHEAADLIGVWDAPEVQAAANRLAVEVRKRYSAEMIYRQILDTAGVDSPQSQPAA